MDILINFVVGVFGGIVLLVLQSIGARLQESRGVFTGNWQQVIVDADESGRVVRKEDLVRCRQKGEVVQADIKRIRPEEQNRRAWYFNGRYRERVLFGHFWAKDLADRSYGTIFLRQTSHDSFSGYYVRQHQVVVKPDQDTVIIRTIPLEWHRTDEK